MNESTKNELESAPTEFSEIINALVAARMDYQTAVKPDTQSIIDSTTVFLPKLNEALKNLVSWNDRTMARIEEAFVAEGISVPKQDDPFWNLVRETNSWGWITAFET